MTQRSSNTVANKGDGRLFLAESSPLAGKLLTAIDHQAAADPME